MITDININKTKEKLQIQGTKALRHIGPIVTKSQLNINNYSSSYLMTEFVIFNKAKNSIKI